jgi:hypothetical protein
MNLKLPLFLFAFILVIQTAWAQKVPAPAEFLGYELGTKFTFHHRVTAYYQEVDRQSDYVILKPYGQTYEGRPLQVAFVSHPDNLKNLEQIRKNNLINAGIEKGNIEGKVLPIVWLSYNVHGNEASGTEAALATLYELAAMKDEKIKTWLNEMIIVLDPCINPDGRDRYANWYNQVGNFPPDLTFESREHQEPWPGGRFNHYLFDLNRDWAWQTQQESQQRLVLYNQWLPQIHVDFHEMGFDAPYYFAPAAKPYYEEITEWQREFQRLVGRNHAKYFDREGWLYYTKEVFDLFYPSYGDTYPTYNGGIGFTYEQGGSGRAGLAIVQPNGDTLTLKDRYTHHLTTSISTIETAFDQRVKLLNEFKKFFSDGLNNPRGAYKTYVLKKSNAKNRLHTFLQLLDKQGIKYGYASTTGSFKGFEYLKNKDGNCTVESEDIVISAYQPKAVLVKALFEPKPKLEDSLTYDLTSWALPFAYELESFALSQRINPSEKNVNLFENFTLPSNQKAYAYIAEWQDFQQVKFLAALLKQGFRVKYANEKFKYQSRSFQPGTLIITRGDNPTKDNRFDLIIRNLAQEMKQEIFAAETGFMDEGRDFGSEELGLILPPKVALVVGNDTSPTDVGPVWYYFEQELKYPLTLLTTERLGQAKLENYQVIILAAGNYNSHSSALLNYVSNGGKIIALEDAMDIFAQDNRTALNKAVSKAEADAKKENENAKDNKWLKKYGQRVRAQMSEGLAGAIYQVQVDETHPLVYGEDNTVSVLKTNRAVYPYLQNGWNVGVFRENTHISGFVGHKLKEKLKNTLAFGVENMGRGKIVYFTDSPIFRSFWHNGKLLLGNAIFFVQ